MSSSCCKYFPTVGRVLFAVPFMVFGVLHLVNGASMQGLVPAFIPGGVWWVYLTGVIFILSSLAILANMHAKKAAVAIAILMMLFVLLVHLPGIMNPATLAVFLPNLLKDTSLMGGALVLAGYLSMKDSCGCAGGGACGRGMCSVMTEEVEEGCCGGDCGGCGDEE